MDDSAADILSDELHLGARHAGIRHFPIGRVVVAFPGYQAKQSRARVNNKISPPAG